jgi:hypothetical protein
MYMYIFYEKMIICNMGFQENLQFSATTDLMDRGHHLIANVWL